MVKKVNAYKAICDGCGKELIDDYSGDPVLAASEWGEISEAEDAGWISYKGNLYCTDCAEETEDGIIFRVESGFDEDANIQDNQNL